MTKRENLLRVIHGERPAWMPCSLNINQWYAHHKRFNALPEELAGTETSLDAMRILGCDIFIRNQGGVQEQLAGGRWDVQTVQGDLGPRTTHRVDTPHGTLQRISEYQDALTTAYEMEDLVKDPEQDLKAYRWLLEHTQYVWDRNIYQQSVKMVGEDGLVLAEVFTSPLKRLHMDMGLDGACLFMADTPELAREMCDIYWSRFFPAIEQMAKDPAVQILCISDNVDTPFYSPAVIAEYWVPYMQQAADVLHRAGKKLIVHACGKLHQLIPAFKEAQVDGLEGMAHPPLGDWTCEDAHAMPKGFIYNGGFSAHEQVSMNDDQVQAFYESFFPRVKDLDSFIFAAACQTALTTPWERIKLVTQLARKHGGKPI